MKSTPILKYLAVQIPAILLAEFVGPFYPWPVVCLLVIVLVMSFRQVNFILLVVFLAQIISYQEFAVTKIPVFDPESEYIIHGRVIGRKSCRDADQIIIKSSFENCACCIQLKIPKNEGIQEGWRITVQGRLAVPAEKRNPGQFDYRKYLLNQGVTHLLDRHSAIIERYPPRLNVYSWFSDLRHKIQQIIHESVPVPFDAVLTGLLLGDKSAIDPEVFQKFQSVGVIHILAVSGLHVGYILLILNAMGKLIPGTPWIRFFLVSFGIVGYMFLTGFPTSVVRAGSMAVLYQYAATRNKQTAAWNTVFAAASGYLLLHPGQLYSLSFQLSFGAVGGILLMMPMMKYLEQRITLLSRLRSKKTIRTATDLLCVSLGAQFGTFLPVALTFYKLPVWGLLANLIIVPLAGLAVLSGFITVCAGFANQWLAFQMGGTTGLILWLMDQACTLFRSLPCQSIHTGSWTSSQLILLWSGLFCMVMVPRVKKPYRLLTPILLLANCILLSSFVNDSTVLVTFLDVGQGDACIIESQNHTILIDGGIGGFGNDQGKYTVIPYCHSKGIRNIDLMILTHPHADHIGGISTILDNVNVAVVWDTWNTYTSGMYLDLKDKMNKLNIPAVHPEPGNVYQLGKMKLTCLYPDSLHSMSVRNINNASIVVRIDYGENAFLFMGDAEEEVEHFLCGLRAVDCDVIKAGHHGSATSSCNEFIDGVNPRHVIVSVGAGNKFNHPAEERMNAWKKSGATVYRTDQTGVIQFRLTENNAAVQTPFRPS